ncbi:MAG: putative sugar O-methyltransferase [Betaproteobacteria bacterium]
MTSRFDHIRAFVREELARREATPAGVLAPSEYWKDYNRFSSYIRALPDEELEHIRYHTWHLTGDKYTFYHFISARGTRELLEDYESRLPQLDGFRPREPAGGFGADTQYGKLNSGILRYAVVLADLHGTGYVPRKGTKRLLELGGGYGGLALMMLQFNPELAYAMCDLEESMFVQAVYLTIHLGKERVHLVRDATALADPRPGHVYLLPQNRADELTKVRFDLAINQQSMQEMTTEQVGRYCDILGKCAEHFYSCNRRSHGAGVVRQKGLVPDLHDYLAKRFKVVWDSTDHVAALARVCLRRKLVRKLVTPFIGKGFLPKGEALLRRFIYKT